MSSARHYLRRLVGGGADEAAQTSLPDVPPSDDRSLFSFLTAVKDWYSRVTDGELSQRLVSWGDLRDVGVVRSNPAGFFTAAPDMAIPPAPTNVLASGAMTHILVEWDNPFDAYGNHAYTEVWAAATDNIGVAVMVGTATGQVFAHSVGPGQSRYYWARFISTSSVAGPYNAVAGVLGLTSNDPSWLLGVLAAQITEDQLYTDLNSRIDLIDGPASLAGSVAQQMYDEAVVRRDAIQLEARTRMAEVQTAAEAALASVLAVQNTRDELQTGIASARFELREEVDAGLSAEASARLTLKAQLEAADGILTAAVVGESGARVNADGAEASSRNALAAQLRGAYDGTDLSLVTTGLIYDERTARVNNDGALAQQISLLSVGTDQFDWNNIWYFDDGVEGWTDSGTPTVTASWLRPSDHGTAAYVASPTGIAANGGTYSQVRLRIRKTGTPTFAGYLWWRDADDTTWDTGKRTAIDAPAEYDANGIASIAVTPAWTGVVDRIRIDLSSAQTATDYFEIDWVAVGRPSPGASYAQVYEERQARLDMADSNVTGSLAYHLDALESSVGFDRGTGVAATATIANAAVTQTNLNGALATAHTALTARFGNQANKIFRELGTGGGPPYAGPVQGSEVVQNLKGEDITVPTISEGDIWYDTRDGNKPYVWSGGTWIYTPDLSAAASDAFIVSTESALANATTSQVQAIRNAVAAVNDPYTGLEAAIALAEDALDAVATVDSARVSEVKTLVAAQNSLAETQLRDILSGEGVRQEVATTAALVRQEVRTEFQAGIFAEASARLTLATVLGGHTAAIQENIESIDGIRAAYWVKIDNNGNMAGYGIASDLMDDGTAVSKFIASVDQFAITAPETSIVGWGSTTGYVAGQVVGVSSSTSLMLVCKVAGTTAVSPRPSLSGAVIGELITDGSVVWQVASRVPFYVLTSAQVINGVTCPPGVYIDGALIVNASINNAQIANGAVDDMKIINLSADKITAGDIATDRMTANIVEAATGRFGLLSALSAYLGNVTINADGWLKSAGVTDFDFGTGMFLGYDEGEYKFRVGNTVVTKATYTASQTIVVPSGATHCEVMLLGGGGGGGNGSDCYYYSSGYWYLYGAGGGGGGAGSLTTTTVSVTGGESLTLVVGSGGSPFSPGVGSALVRGFTSIASAAGGSPGTTAYDNHHGVGGGGAANGTDPLPNNGGSGYGGDGESSDYGAGGFGGLPKEMGGQVGSAGGYGAGGGGGGGGFGATYGVTGGLGSGGYAEITFFYGNPNPKYICWDGEDLSIRANGLVLEDGNATFSGNLAGARGTFSGRLVAAEGTFNGTLMAGAMDMSAFGGTLIKVLPSDYTPGTPYSITVPDGFNTVRVTCVGGGGGGGTGGGGRSNKIGDKFDTAGGGGGGGGGSGLISTEAVVLKDASGVEYTNCTVSITLGTAGAALSAGGTTTAVVKTSGGTTLKSVTAGGGTSGANGNDGYANGGTEYGGTGGAGGFGADPGNSGAGGSSINETSSVPGWGGAGGTGGTPGYPEAQGSGGTGGAGGTAQAASLPGYWAGSGGTSGQSGMIYIEFFNDKIVVLREEYDTLKAAHNSLAAAYTAQFGGTYTV